MALGLIWKLLRKRVYRSVLKYIGGGRYILGVPARDLVDGEIQELHLAMEALVRSDLYVYVDERSVLAEIEIVAPDQ